MQSIVGGIIKLREYHFASTLVLKHVDALVTRGRNQFPNDFGDLCCVVRDLSYLAAKDSLVYGACVKFYSCCLCIALLSV